MQHDFCEVQHALWVEQQLGAALWAPTWQHASPPPWQHAAPGWQQLELVDACDLTPKPTSPKTAAPINVITDLRFMMNSRI